jgi:hypothetical protein
MPVPPSGPARVSRTERLRACIGARSANLYRSAEPTRRQGFATAGLAGQLPGRVAVQADGPTIQGIDTDCSTDGTLTVPHVPPPS